MGKRGARQLGDFDSIHHEGAGCWIIYSAMRLSKVVFPLPEGPIKAMNVPSSTSMSRSLKGVIVAAPFLYTRVSFLHSIKLIMFSVIGWLMGYSLMTRTFFPFFSSDGDLVITRSQGCNPSRTSTQPSFRIWPSFTDLGATNRFCRRNRKLPRQTTSIAAFESIFRPE